MSTATVAKSATAAASGSSLTILGNMAGLTGADWALVIFCVFGSVFGGSYAMAASTVALIFLLGAAASLAMPKPTGRMIE